MNQCTSELCLDLAETAGFHAQITGVLAGLSFTVLAVVLTLTPARTRDSNGLLTLLVSIGTFTMASFMYGTAAGDEAGAARTGALTLTAGVVASVAFCLLFLGIAFLAERVHDADASDAMRRLITGGAPLLATVYVVVSAIDLLRANTRDDGWGLLVEITVAVLAVATAGTLGWGLAGWNSSSTGAAGPKEVEQTISRQAALPVGIGLVTFLVVVYWPDSAQWLGIVPLVLLAWFWFAVRFSVEARRLIPQRVDPAATPEQS